MYGENMKLKWQMKRVNHTTSASSDFAILNAITLFFIVCSAAKVSMSLSFTTPLMLLSVGGVEIELLRERSEFVFGLERGEGVTC
jgi:hypothetical protein